jgi:hypothetical protein
MKWLSLESVLLAWLFMAWVSPSVAADKASSSKVQRGKYLVVEVARCEDCHTPIFSLAEDYEQRRQRTTVGANAKETRKAPQSNRRFFVAIFESRSATPANNAMMETGIEVNVDKPITNGTHDASIPSVGHQSQKPQNIPPIPPRSDAIRSHRHPSLDKAVPSP